MEEMELDSAQDKLMQLLPEIREHIYNKLRQKDALTVRLVSTQYRDDIDSMFRFNIKLDDEKRTSEAIQFLVSKKIRKCEVVSLKKKPVTTPMFKYPSYIRDLIIRMDRKIAPINFPIVMRECCQYVKNLHVILDYNCDLISFDYHQNRSPALYKFDNLEKLKLSQIMCWDKYGSCNFNNSILKHVLNSAVQSKFKSFKVYFEYLPEQPETQQLIFSLISQSKTLERFTYDPVYDYVGKDVTNQNPSFYNDYPVSLSRINCLKKFFLTSNYKKLSAKNDFSLQFLHSQKKLEEIGITIYDCSKEIYNSLNLFQILLNNSKTLNVIHLAFAPSFDGHFDMEVFKNCKNLKTLTIEIAGEPRNEWNLKNFFLLPKSVEFLLFRGCDILRSELEIYFENEDELKSLKTFHIVDGSMAEERRVNDGLLEKILGFQNILEVSFEDLELSPECVNKMSSIMSDWHNHTKSSCDCNFTTDRINIAHRLSLSRDIVKNLSS